MAGFTYAIVFVLLVFSILVDRYVRRKKENPAGLPLPPGPPRLPIVGNLFGIRDLGAQWLTYAEWGRKYGDLLYVEILGQKMLIINSEKIAQELLDQRSTNYSDRPQVLMVKLMDWGFNVGFIPYGPSWRRHRKSMHQALNPQAMISYQGLQLDKVHQMVRNMIDVPHEMEAHIRTFTASTIMQVLYGYEMAPRNDLFASIADRASEMLTNSFFPGAALVNTFPIFQHLPEWFPGAGFKKYARQCRKLTRALRDKPYEYVQKAMADGTAPHSVVSEMIKREEEEALIKSVAGTTYAAAVETSSSALSAFMMAMVMFPEVRKKAQAEIDLVTGGIRMPNFGDREFMIYLEATYREVLRWCQVTPLGVPHMTTESDVYNGYFIPKDTIVFANIWAMTHDERMYTEPFRFMPERFIKGDGTLSDDIGEQQFGFGRRICVGKYLAEAAVWIAMVSVLAVFDVKKAIDELGREIDVIPRFTPGVIIHPEPFPFSITPRSEKAAALVQRDVFGNGRACS